MASLIRLVEGSIPSENPPANRYFIGIDSADGRFYIKDSAGTVVKPDVGTGIDWSEDFTNVAFATDNVWTSTNLGAGYEDALVEINFVVSSNNTTVGVREVGSSLVRAVRIDIDSVFTISVRADSSGNVEFFTSSSAATTITIQAVWQ
jgi:hypothetical protein